MQPGSASLKDPSTALGWRGECPKEAVDAGSGGAGGSSEMQKILNWIKAWGLPCAPDRDNLSTQTG